MVCSCFPILAIRSSGGDEDQIVRSIKPIPTAYLNSIGGGGDGENKHFTKMAAKFQLLISTLILILTVGLLLKSAHNSINYENPQVTTTTTNGELFMSGNSALIAAISVAAMVFTMSLTFLVGVERTGPRFLAVWIWVYFLLTLVMAIVFMVRHEFLGKDGTFLVVAGIFAIFFINFILVRVVMKKKGQQDEQHLVRN